MGESSMPAKLSQCNKAATESIKPCPKRLRYTEAGSNHASSTPPTFPDLPAFDPDLFNANLSAFLHDWIPQTLSIFGPTGPAVSTRAFWASQLRSDLFHELWQPRFLGHEATDDELDWLVESALRLHWPRIEAMLERRVCEERAAPVEERYPRRSKGRTRLRRSYVLGEVTGRLNIEQKEEEEEEDGGVFEGEECEVVPCSVRERQRGMSMRESQSRGFKVDMQELDDWLGSLVISGVGVTKAKERPAQAGSLLKKTLRSH
jgi:hypothetical protein